MKRNISILLAIVFTTFLIAIIINKSREPKALVAFVIDDWGYNLRNIDLIFQIERPLTISILPNLRYSKDITDIIRKKSKMYDIILHLPMESKSDRSAEIDTIRCDMEEDKILSVMEESITSVPGIIGVSNHQGSKATEDERVMRIILSELKRRNLFFLDSLTTPDSVGLKVAGDIGLRCARRDVFLDLTDQTDLEHFESYIRKQIKELAGIAIARGLAIGIGHNRETTLKVIQDTIPELEKQGIKIVPLRDLVK